MTCFIFRVFFLRFVGFYLIFKFCGAVFFVKCFIRIKVPLSIETSRIPRAVVSPILRRRLPPSPVAALRLLRRRAPPASRFQEPPVPSALSAAPPRRRTPRASLPPAPGPRSGRPPRGAHPLHGQSRDRLIQGQVLETEGGPTVPTAGPLLRGRTDGVRRRGRHRGGALLFLDCRRRRAAPARLAEGRPRVVVVVLVLFTVRSDFNEFLVFLDAFHDAWGRRRRDGFVAVS